jgi:hypothetical protein
LVREERAELLATVDEVARATLRATAVECEIVLRYYGRAMSAKQHQREAESLAQRDLMA